MKHTFHCLGIPHTITSQEYCACAYTAKVLKFIEMMTKRGHTCYHYGHPDSTVACENVPVVTRETFEKDYGANETQNQFFQFDLSDATYKQHQRNAAIEIGKRKKGPKEFILSFFSVAGEPVCKAHPELIHVEPGIGYSNGHFAPFKVFESYSLFHQYYGLEHSGVAKMEWHTCVIPNYFDPDDFEFRSGGDYYLFLGRIYEGKGVHLVIQLAREMPNQRFLIAGQNRAYVDDNYGEGKAESLPPNVKIVGFADRNTRRALYRDAKGVFCLSQYLEPFGGVAVESMLSGTPVISTDWGAFTETVLHGHVGYRVRSFEQLLWAARNIDRIDPRNCIEWALKNYTLETVAPRYEEYFYLISKMHAQPQGGWYEPHHGRSELAHLTATFPFCRERQNFQWMAEEEAPLAEHVAAWIKAQSPSKVADVGCGPGHFVEALLSEGVPAIGYEIDIRRQEKGITYGDITDDVRLASEEVVLCLEVLEHIAPEDTGTAIANLAAMTKKTLIFSAGRPGQGGIGHINCRESAEWKDLISKRGLSYSASLTANLIESVDPTTTPGWFINNVMVFERAKICSPLTSPAPAKAPAASLAG